VGKLDHAQFRNAEPAEPHPYVPRASERVSVVHETQAKLENGREIRIQICDMSRHGILCEQGGPLTVGTAINVLLPVAGWVKAHVRWARDGRAGCQFDEPLSGGIFYPSLTEMMTERAAPRATEGAYEVPTGLVPLEIMQVNRLFRFRAGSFARSTADRNEAYFVGTSGGRPVFIRHQDNGYFYADLADAMFDVAGVAGVRFMVDWSTALPIENQETKNGALCLQRGSVLICATPWNDRGRHLIEVGRSELSGHGEANVSFTRWTAYVRHEGADHIVWREGGE
jgi:hypothetical protein